jgi:hypothetical protein
VRARAVAGAPHRCQVQADVRLLQLCGAQPRGARGAHGELVRQLTLTPRASTLTPQPSPSASLTLTRTLTLPPNPNPQPRGAHGELSASWRLDPHGLRATSHCAHGLPAAWAPPPHPHAAPYCRHPRAHEMTYGSACLQRRLPHVWRAAVDRVLHRRRALPLQVDAHLPYSDGPYSDGPYSDGPYSDGPY